MPTPTYTPLATVTLASSASSVTFSSIPATYRDLILVANYQNSGLSSATRLRVNGDSGSNYNGVWMIGTGSAAQAGPESNQTSARVGGANSGPHNTFSNTLLFSFMDYQATDKHKTILSRFGSANTETQATASRWASTSAITSIYVFDVLGQTFQTGSTFSLYGVIA
jgi:P2-related tail formation protein